MLIKVCLNGARDATAHPALPLSSAALAAAAQSAVRGCRGDPYAPGQCPGCAIA
jgi:hypothetical protein